MRHLSAPILLTILLLWYTSAIAVRAWAMLTSGSGVLIAMGVAAIIIFGLTLWFVVVEWRLAVITEKMRKQALEIGGLIIDDLPRSPGGRIDLASAQAQLAELTEKTTAEPQSWLAWYNRAWAADAARERATARQCLRRAATLFSTQHSHGA